MTGSADLLIVGARVWSGAVVPGADALAVREGRVLAVGRAEALASLRGPATRVVDARGGTVTPGLVDAHLHLLAWARSLSEIDLAPCRSRAEVVARVADHLRNHPGDSPVFGRGWQSASWSEAPERAPLDALAADRPVLLYSHDYHNLWVNGAALRHARIDRNTPDPAGGWIDRDVRGEPNGLLREHAMRLVSGLESAGADDAARLDRAAGRLHAAGITAVHCFEGAETLRLWNRARRAERPLRALMHLAHADLDHAIALGLPSGCGDDLLRIGAVKLFADGTLGSRTASLLEPYDGGSERGEELLAPREIEAIVRRAFGAGISVAVHAIGDRACRVTLDAFESSRSAIASLALPPRIEHVQLLDPADAPRFAALGVAASMQPSHCPSDRELAEKYWGSRRERTYPWRTLLDQGAVLAFGSDAPVEPPLPSLGLHAAVTRTRPDEAVAYAPEQRLTLDQALVAYTEGPARLAGQWPRVGRLAAGAAADLVVWDSDLHARRADDLWQARPFLTAVAGTIVFDAEAGDVARPETVASRARTAA